MTRKLLEIIGRRLPAVYDVIPRGPLHLLDAVALNPQPLPPREHGAAVAAEFLRAAWTANRHGLDPGVVFEELDDWCPTRPKKIKLPPWWPPVPDPDPHPDWLVAFHLGFAARLAVAPLEKGTLSGLVDKAIERSLAVVDAAK